jgi:hypothetical protein
MNVHFYVPPLLTFNRQKNKTKRLTLVEIPIHRREAKRIAVDSISLEQWKRRRECEGKISRVCSPD